MVWWWVWVAGAVGVGWGVWWWVLRLVWVLSFVGLDYRGFFVVLAFVLHFGKTAISGLWGGFGVLGLCGWAGAAGAGQCCEFGRFRFGGQINTGDRKSGLEGQRVDLGGRRGIKVRMEGWGAAGGLGLRMCGGAARWG